MSKLRGVVFVTAVHLLECRSVEHQPASAVSSPPDLAASAPPGAAGSTAAGTAAAGSAELRGEERLPSTEAPAPEHPEKDANRAEAAKPPNRDEGVKLQQCCVQLEDLGKKRGQEGTTFTALSSVCDEMAIAFRAGERPDIDSSTWEEIRSALAEEGIPLGCRALMLSFEKR